MLMRPPSPVVLPQKAAPDQTSGGQTTPLKSGRKKLPLQDAPANHTPIPTPERRPPLAKEPRKAGPKAAPVDVGVRCEDVLSTSECRVLITVGKRVWAAEREGCVTVRDGATGEVLHTIPSQEQFCWCLLYCGDRVWTGWSTGHIRVYHPQTFELVKELFHHSGGVYCLAHSPQRLYSGSNDFEIFQWNTETYEFMRQFSGHKNSVRCLAVVGSTLISGSDDFTIRLWDTVTGDVRELAGHRGGVLAVARKDDKLWSSAEDGLIKVWALQSGECLATKADHTGRITTLLPIGDRVWSAGVDKSIYVHAAAAPFNCLAVFPDHKGYINNVAVVAECTKYRLWSCSSDKTIRVWSAEVPLVEAAAPEPQQPMVDAERYLALQRELASLKEELDNRNRMLQDKDTIIEAGKREKAAIEDKYQQVIRRKDEGLQEKEQEIVKLKHMLADRDFKNGELQGQASHKDKIIRDLENKLAALNACVEDNNRTISDLHRQLEKLKLEGLQQDRELRRVAESQGLLNTEADRARRENDEWRKRFEAEKLAADELRAKLRDADALAGKLREQLRKFEEDLRQREAAMAEKEKDFADKQQLMEQLEREREEHQKRLAEFEFVIQSRSELVRQIWELFCEISESKKQAAVVFASPELKRLRSESVTHDVTTMLDAAKGAKDRCRRIVANFFTEVEKFHVGTSPYYFPPDADAHKYKFSEQNLDGLKKFASNDLRRAGALCYKDKGAPPEAAEKPVKAEEAPTPAKPDAAAGQAPAAAVAAPATPTPPPPVSGRRSTSPPAEGARSYMASTASSSLRKNSRGVPATPLVQRPAPVVRPPKPPQTSEKPQAKRWM